MDSAAIEPDPPWLEGDLPESVASDLIEVGWN
jgi:hypothetical protein